MPRAASKSRHIHRVDYIRMDEALDILAHVPVIGRSCEVCLDFDESNAAVDACAQDGHNDWPHLIRGFYDNKIETDAFDAESDLVGHVDVKRLVAGRVGGVFLSAYVDW
jgi:hypothetical protein